MQRSEIISTLLPKIAAEFEIEPADILPEAVIYDTLDLDSISLVDLVGIVQTTFRVKLEKSDLEAIKTFDDLYTFIENHL